MKYVCFCVFRYSHIDILQADLEENDSMTPMFLLRNPRALMDWASTEFDIIFDMVNRKRTRQCFTALPPALAHFSPVYLCCCAAFAVEENVYAMGDVDECSRYKRDLSRI